VLLHCVGIHWDTDPEQVLHMIQLSAGERKLEDQIEYKLGRLRPPLRMPSHPLGMSSSTSTKQTARGPNKPAPGNAEFHLDKAARAKHEQAQPQPGRVPPPRSSPPTAPTDSTPSQPSPTT